MPGPDLDRGASPLRGSLNVVTSLDTTDEASRVQRTAWAQMGPHRRVWIAAEMSDDAREIAAAGVRHRNPDWSEVRVRRQVLVQVYGADLVERAWGPISEG